MEVFEDMDKAGAVELPPEHCQLPLHCPSDFREQRNLNVPAEILE